MNDIDLRPMHALIKDASMLKWMDNLNHETGDILLGDEESPTTSAPDEGVLFEDILNYLIEKVQTTGNNIELNLLAQQLNSLIEQLNTLIEAMGKRQKEHELHTIKINVLLTNRLRDPLDVIIEADEEGFIARTADFPLFGYGDDTVEAIDSLKSEIESLYQDLMEDDNFTEEWKPIKNFLKEQII